MKGIGFQQGRNAKRNPGATSLWELFSYPFFDGAQGKKYMEPTINATQLNFQYETEQGPREVLRRLSLTLKSGEWVALLGCNGSGKSTFTKLADFLLRPTQGELEVLGQTPENDTEAWKLREHIGLVFQNPDNQFVSPIVGEDLHFGLENYGYSPEERETRIQQALGLVHLQGFENREIHTLSGGQKQRVALAAVLALRPTLLLLDEVTSMLDPVGKAELMEVFRELHEAGHTLLMVTHDVEEALQADRVFLLHEGSLWLEGTPSAVLSQTKRLKKAGLLPPPGLELQQRLLSLRESMGVESFCRSYPQLSRLPSTDVRALGTIEDWEAFLC